MAAFALARHAGRGQSLLARGRLRRVDDLLGQRGFVGVLAVRLVPVAPFTVVNYSSGFSSVRTINYVLGTAVGILPGSLLFVGLGAESARLTGWRFAGGAVAAVVAGAAALRVRQVRRRS